MRTTRLICVLWILLRSAAAAAEEVPAAQQTTAQADFEQLIDAALGSLRFEPSLEELKTAALRFADADIERARSWRRAPNAAAALPTLKFVFHRDLERDESLDRYQDEPDRWGADTDRGLGVDVSAQWKLDELIFNPHELKVYDALADRALRRENLLAVLVGYYYERRRLQLEAVLVPPTDVKEALDRHIRISELTAAIDALTGGLLSSKLGDIK